MEFLEGSEAVGADIDIGNEVAKRLGRTAEFTNIGFDGIIAALQSDLCDAIISGMNNTPERAEQVDFVNYLLVGQSLVVQAGNPEGITSLETLCGHAAGAQVGSTNLDTINAANEACTAAGKEAIDVTGFPSDTDGILALKADRIDAYETDSPGAAYYIAQDPEVVRVRRTGNRCATGRYRGAQGQHGVARPDPGGDRRDVCRRHDDGDSGKVAAAGLRAAGSGRGDPGSDAGRKLASGSGDQRRMVDYRRAHP